MRLKEQDVQNTPGIGVKSINKWQRSLYSIVRTGSVELSSSRLARETTPALPVRGDDGACRHGVLPREYPPISVQL